MTGILIFIGLILVILNVLAIKKQNKSFNGMLGNAIENIDDYDIRLGELRREFSESILELQSEIMNMKEIMDSSRLNNNYDSTKQENTHSFEKIEKIPPVKLHSEVINNKEEAKEICDENKNEIVTDELDNTNTLKVREIKRLFSEGLSAEAISEILQLGKGEVLLIKDLYIR